jgi:thiamine-monophosphate kinase
MVAKRRQSKAPSVSNGPDERRIIELLTGVLGRKAPNARVGIGDDAAVLDLGSGSVWSIDTSVEGVHFRREWLTLEQAARRSFHAAVSDLAAMGARPVAALSSLILPANCSEREILSIGRGQASAAHELGCPVVGGNVSRGTELSITVSVIGRAKAPLLRSKAKIGDELWLIGSVGQARAGLLSFLEPPTVRSGSKAARTIARCRDTWVYPRARLTEGIALARAAHAAIDVSDGLARDADHLASESGVQVVIDAKLLESTLTEELCEAALILGRDPLSLALEGGEDYALLATGPAAKRPRTAKVIGAVRKGQGAILIAQGREQPMPSGFDHFGSRNRLEK